MADLSGLFNKVLDVADSVNEYLPAAGLTQGGIDLARKVEDLLNSFGNDIPASQQATAQTTRAQLAAKVAAKARATSNRARGED